jgi:hypothetical protein
VETFARVSKHFGSWPRAKEVVDLATTTTARSIEARFRDRKLGRVWRFTEERLKTALQECYEHYGDVPSVAEFERMPFAESADDARCRSRRCRLGGRYRRLVSR